MANISQVRGALLEEAVLYLLEKFDYKTIKPILDMAMKPFVVVILVSKLGVEGPGIKLMH